MRLRLNREHSFFKDKQTFTEKVRGRRSEPSGLRGLRKPVTEGPLGLRREQGGEKAQRRRRGTQGVGKDRRLCAPERRERAHRSGTFGTSARWQRAQPPGKPAYHGVPRPPECSTTFVPKLWWGTKLPLYFYEHLKWITTFVLENVVFCLYIRPIIKKYITLGKN